VLCGSGFNRRKKEENIEIIGRVEKLVDRGKGLEEPEKNEEENEEE